jgi:hypothetical protein
MTRSIVSLLVAVLLAAVFYQSSFAQRGRPTVRFPHGSSRTQPKPESPKYPPLPNDQRLLAIHLEFVKKAEALAQEYERDKEFGKAKDVYQEILKLVPQYPPARAKLGELTKHEATADRATFVVQANKTWQDTGVTVIPGKPITIRAAGTWTFNLSSELGPDGLKIPTNLKGYSLGALVGIVSSPTVKEPRPFTVGSEHSFTADRKGKLMLRMYDIRPEDNKGSMNVEIVGTFEK